MKDILFNDPTRTPEVLGFTTAYGMEACVKAFSGEPVISKKPTIQDFAEQYVAIEEAPKYRMWPRAMDAKDMDHNEWDKMVDYVEDLVDDSRITRIPLPRSTEELLDYLAKVMHMLDAAEWRENRLEKMVKELIETAWYLREMVDLGLPDTEKKLRDIEKAAARHYGDPGGPAPWEKEY